MLRSGGRPRQVETDDIIRVGRELGLSRLSMNAVADSLGVSATALYRHVDGRWELERLIGESILADLRLGDDPAHDAVQHLLAAGLQLRSFVLAHHGLAAYVQALFPRGESGRQLLSGEVEALGRRGYAPDAAMVLASAVASIAIGYAAAEEVQRERAEGRPEQERHVLAALTADARLGDAHRALPEVDNDLYVRLWLGAAVRAFVEAAPPGRPLAEVMAALDAAGKGL